MTVSFSHCHSTPLAAREIVFTCTTTLSTLDNKHVRYMNYPLRAAQKFYFGQPAFPSRIILKITGVDNKDGLIETKYFQKWD